ncbi:MAG: competence/damage-inducible protein A [Candidatus Korobacteraceae bacterium]
MNAEIIAVGSEMLTPYRQDTNSLFLTKQLNDLGVEVIFKGVVGDHRERLVECIRQALSRTEILICTGGLGPTEDDLTRECVAEALGLGLRVDPDILAALYARFATRRIQMSPNNARQADIVEGAEVLRNPRGTAPGQFMTAQYDGERKIIILLPGPPWELEPLFQTECVPRLKPLLPPRFIATRELKLAMVPESQADLRAAPIEVQLHLRTGADTEEEAQARVDRLASELEDEFEESVFSTAGESLEKIVGYYLQMRDATISVAESCTGGLLAERITSVSGSSRYFVGGAVVYSNDLKSLFCNVPPLLIAEHGAVSKPVAIAMAEGIRKRCRSALGVGITGVAGPTGGTEEKPVGLVYIALADNVKTEVTERRFPGDRERIRHWATQQALDMIRRRLI